jgi:hypothetical protein
MVFVLDIICCANRLTEWDESSIVAYVINCCCLLAQEDRKADMQRHEDLADTDWVWPLWTRTRWSQSLNPRRRCSVPNSR